MTKYALDADWEDSACYVVTINAKLIPIIAGQMRLLELRGSWVDSDNYERGYNAIVAFERCIMAACLNDMLDIQRATYRMLDNALYGTVYTVESSDPLIVSPDIPAVRQLSDANTGSLLDRSLDVNQLLQNALNGTITDRYADVPGIRAQLQSILDALTSGDTDLTTVISDLELIIGALA